MDYRLKFVNDNHSIPRLPLSQLDVTRAGLGHCALHQRALLTGTGIFMVHLAEVVSDIIAQNDCTASLAKQDTGIKETEVELG